MPPGQVLALWLAGARVDQVGAAAVLAEGVGFGTGEIAAVAAVQLLDLAIVSGKQDVPEAERLAPHRAGAIFLAAAVERDRGVEIEFEPVEIGLGLDVDHDRVRIRTAAHTYELQSIMRTLYA